VAIKGSLDELDALQHQRAKVMEEGVQKLTNFNAIEDLMAVSQGTKNKGDIFTKHQNEYRGVFA
jgi:hypothetical protein